MKKCTQREIKSFVSCNMAVDLTKSGFDFMNDFIKNHRLDKIVYSSGTYGINGGIVQDIDTGEYYAVTCRCPSLLMLF